MKKLNFLLVVLCMQAITVWQSKIQAQKADTLTVINATQPGDLYKFISGDTLANGNRVNPNRYYRLERTKLYVLNGPMTFRHDVNIIADNDNPLSPTRPPMVVNG